MGATPGGGQPLAVVCAWSSLVSSQMLAPFPRHSPPSIQAPSAEGKARPLFWALARSGG